MCVRPRVCVPVCVSQGLISSTDVYVVRDGRRPDPEERLQRGAVYRLEPRLRGGKGGVLMSNAIRTPSSSVASRPLLLWCDSGFGSMLRALGAQIEKTTNREACRDLSGRRLRDVNHEKE